MTTIQFIWMIVAPVVLAIGAYFRQMLTTWFKTHGLKLDSIEEKVNGHSQTIQQIFTDKLLENQRLQARITLLEAALPKKLETEVASPLSAAPVPMPK